ncbi:MAG: hypothetical protein ACYDDO_09275 [Acidiferrobacterales bacterium]
MTSMPHSRRFRRMAPDPLRPSVLAFAAMDQTPALYGSAHKRRTQTREFRTQKCVAKISTRANDAKIANTFMVLPAP